MDFAEVFSEFMVPGVLVAGSSVLLLSHTPAGADFLEPFSSGGAAAASTLFFIAISYVLGILCSEFGTLLVRGVGDRTVRAGISSRVSELAATPWGASKADAVIGWGDFSYIRAAGRRQGSGAAKRIEGHESVLRILRGSVAAVPLSVWTVSGVLLHRADISETGSMALGALPAIGSFLVLRAAFKQRCSTAVRSSVDHYLAGYEGSEGRGIATD